MTSMPAVVLLVALTLAGFTGRAFSVEIVEVLVGEQAQLICQLTADRLKSFEWTKGPTDHNRFFIYLYTSGTNSGDDINELIRNRTEVIGHTLLVINDTNFEDADTYRCDAYYHDGKPDNSSKVKLTVIQPDTENHEPYVSTAVPESNHSNNTSETTISTAVPESNHSNNTSETTNVGGIVGGILGVIGLVGIGIVCYLKRRPLRLYLQSHCHQGEHDVEATSPMIPMSQIARECADTSQSMSGLGVVVILPSWGEDVGGIYSAAYSLIRYLKQKQCDVFCLTGKTQEEMSQDNKDLTEQLGVETIGPIIQSGTPEQRVQDNINSFIKTDITKYLKKCDYIVSTALSTHELARCLLYREEADKCKLVLFNNSVPGIEEPNGIILVDSIRSASAVVSLSDEALQSLEGQEMYTNSCASHQLVIPNMEDDIWKRTSESPQQSNTLFVPVDGFEDGLVEQLHRSVSRYNDTGATDKIKIKMHGEIPTTPDKRHCDSLALKSVQEITQKASQCAAVIASGTFRGISGLEFLVNGHVTLVPNDTPVAKLLRDALQEKAESFILNYDSKICHQIKADISRQQNCLEEINLLKIYISQHSKFNWEDAIVHPSSPDLSEKTQKFDGLRNDHTKFLEGVNHVFKSSFSDQEVERVVKSTSKVPGLNMKAAVAEMNVFAKMIRATPHENIINIYECLYSARFLCMYVEMDFAISSMSKYMSEKDTNEYTELTEMRKNQVVGQIFAGLEHLHGLMIIHDNIKPSNVMFTDTDSSIIQVKLSDFGCARVKCKLGTNAHSSQMEDCGSLMYVSPEKSCFGTKSQRSSDVWSACLVSTEWYSGDLSWKEGITAEIEKRSKNMPPELASVPDRVHEILRKGLQYEPDQRPTAQEILNKIEKVIKK